MKACESRVLAEDFKPQPIEVQIWVNSIAWLWPLVGMLQSACQPCSNHAQVQGVQPMDIDVDQMSVQLLEDQELLALASAPLSQMEGGNNLASNEPSHQRLRGSAQISPEDEELLALAEAPLSQVQEAQDAAAQLQDVPQISPEDEELLALAQEPLSQIQEAQPSAQDAAAQPMQHPAQISPEDEELLALAEAPLSQPEAPQASPGAVRARPAHGTWQSSPEVEELLALASAPEAQLLTAQPAVEAPRAQPGNVPTVLSPEDEELCALAAAPLSQPGSLQAAAAVETGKQPHHCAQAPASAGVEELVAPPFASSTGAPVMQDLQGATDCSTPAPALSIQADHTPQPQQLSAGAQVAPQGSQPGAHRSPISRQLLMLSSSPSSCQRQRDGMASQPRVITEDNAVLPGMC